MSTATDYKTGLLGWRLQAARELAFVGRQEELAVFNAALYGNGCSVLYVHGPGGIGKSALLRRFAQEAEAAGRPVVKLDGRLLPTSVAAFEAEAGEVLRDDRAVLLFDAFEEIQSLEGWLWERFLPRVPMGALVVIAGRLPPEMQWQADPGWVGALKVMTLRDLPPEETHALLDSCGVADELRESVLGFAGGHPLALLLAAAARNGTREGGSVLCHDAVSTLLDQMVGEVPSAAHQKALEICAHAFVTTEDLLRAFMPEQAGMLFRWLRRLPFVESSSLGLFPHDVVREGLEIDFRWRDPQGHAEMHERIHEHLAEKVHTVSDADVLGAVGALLYLHRDEEASSAFHSARAEAPVEEGFLRTGDLDKLCQVAAESDGEESAAAAVFWAQRQPEAFRAYRLIETGEPVAFFAWLTLSDLADEEIAADPVVASVWAHARATAPLRAGEHLAVGRIWGIPARLRKTPAMDLMAWRAVGNSLRSERMAWSYIAMRRPNQGIVECLRRYGLDEHTERPVMDGARFTLFTHDWRAVPAQAWLERLSRVPVSVGQFPSAKLAVLSRAEFAEAIRQALRQMSRLDALASSPLTRTRLITERGGGDPATTLRDLLRQVIDELGEDPRSVKFHRALSATFLNGAPTQEVAAERLGLPFTTYRRHLVAGIERVCAELWHLELYGTAQDQKARD
ncbi:ATP-binding protein [Spongiactinospora gelatinilytica]|uniref:ATP-binding protein n=1 Tax=Spongiactinospora gelatinilytica TaxID=2666298 RepID=A0A2W2HUT9_9ACTN|nr:ATP-binding protein [Spongiactinospora gelatinilytica]PZG55355.1 ATP-binding protein [Spongiactinospora gelatinilytica]